MSPDPKPNVLGMVLKGYPRISESFISNEIRLLEKNGFSVHIFSMHPPREDVRHESVSRIRAHVDYLPETFFSGPLLGANLSLLIRKPLDYIKGLMSALVLVFKSGKLKTLRHFLLSGYMVSRLFPGRRIGRLHAHFAHSPASVAMFAARMSGLEFSFTAHAKDIYTSPALELREKIDSACFVATCTQYNQIRLSAMSKRKHPRIFRVYHGIDMRLFTSGSIDEPPRMPYRIITVARLVPKKGLPVVMEAVARLLAEGLAVEYTLIGDGKDRGEILDRAKTLGLGDAFQWLGTLSHEDVLAHFRRSHVFAIGCRIAEDGDRDGIPNVLAESMAMNVPVVATRVSAIPELIQDELTGLLVPPDDPDRMARALKRLLTDDMLRHRIIEAARGRVNTFFDNQVLIRELITIYQRHDNRFADERDR